MSKENTIETVEQFDSLLNKYINKESSKIILIYPPFFPINKIFEKSQYYDSAFALREAANTVNDKYVVDVKKIDAGKSIFYGFCDNLDEVMSFIAEKITVFIIGEDYASFETRDKSDVEELEPYLITMNGQVIDNKVQYQILYDSIYAACRKGQTLRSEVKTNTTHIIHLISKMIKKDEVNTEASKITSLSAKNVSENKKEEFENKEKEEDSDGKESWLWSFKFTHPNN